MGCGASRDSGHSQVIAARPQELAEESDKYERSVEQAYAETILPLYSLAETPKSGRKTSTEDKARQTELHTENTEVPDGRNQIQYPDEPTSTIATIRSCKDHAERTNGSDPVEHDSELATVQSAVFQRLDTLNDLPASQVSSLDSASPTLHPSAEPLREDDGDPLSSMLPDDHKNLYCTQNAKLEQRSEPHNEERTAALEQASSLHSHACQSLADGGHQDAEEAFTQCLTVLEDVYGADHIEVVATAENLGWLYTTMGRLEE
eukprot:CAMPEP_0118952576 /NCGR_PEP_ID=MMETSP1169-20130426/55105_1 /TAXON_ID=36882 /ORGANISM="Pyramimonas obovata, Strain CCMP722" /LENGTH=261 /DNA_ID=CAMNT_0006899867 /DNA_START=137 /DNA_END=919 /DNA_ORIENTATION=-